MNVVKKINKIVVVGVIGLLGLATLTGCSQGITQEDLKAQINEAVAKAASDAKTQGISQGIASVDITKDNAQAVEAAVAAQKAETERLALVIEDMKKAQAEIELEDKNTEVVPKVEEYLIDDVALDGTFGEQVDSGDFDSLAYTSIDYDGEEYIAEEKIVISDDFKPVLNLKDLNGVIAVEISDKNAVEYSLTFDEEVITNPEDEDETLDVSFLGKTMKIVDYDADQQEITYRVSNTLTKKVGDSFTAEGKTISIESVNVDGDKAYIQVGDVADSVSEGKTKKINGVEIYLEDVFEGDNLDAVRLQVGKDVTRTVVDGDEYDSDDRYEWIIEGDDGISKIGITLVETYEDEDEVLLEGKSISLPNDYMKLVFAGTKYMEVKDLSLDISKTEIDVDYEGTIEVDGDKIDDSKLTILDDGTYEYRYKGDKKTETDLSLIKIINGDRELSLDIDDDNVYVYDSDVDYEFAYQFGDDYAFTSSAIDAEEMNEDDDYRVVNGDLLYKSDINSEDEENAVTIGLVSDEEVEALLKIVK